MTVIRDISLQAASVSVATLLFTQFVELNTVTEMTWHTKYLELFSIWFLHRENVANFWCRESEILRAGAVVSRPCSLSHRSLCWLPECPYDMATITSQGQKVRGLCSNNPASEETCHHDAVLFWHREPQGHGNSTQV